MSYRPSNPIPGLRYHTFDMERGLRHMDIYGVEYYVSFTPEATEKAKETDGFYEIAVSEPFHIFRLPQTDLVVPATKQPSVYEVPASGLGGSLFSNETVADDSGLSRPSFYDMALDWYEDIDNMDRWVTADGPADWPRITSLDERSDVPLDVPQDAVSNIVVGEDRISFTTEAIGVPHMVKVSYFPNWTATGAEGPWRATPSLMVVVPTQRDVVLEFRDTWAESGGKVLTVVGVGALLAVGGLFLWRRRVSGEESAAS
jgi:LPXTG-motif cell wall-anchored protein